MLIFADEVDQNMMQFEETFMLHDPRIDMPHTRRTAFDADIVRPPRTEE